MRSRPRSRRAAACARRAAAFGARGIHREPEARAAARRAGGTRSENGGIDWGQAEALAFASLLEDGIPIRLTGQDTERGTFSHRHLVFHDPETGETCARSRTCRAPTPRSRSTTRRSRSTRRSASSTATPVAAPDALVLWEAQFGDFVNGAQIVIDQFIVAGRSKWDQTSRLTLLLPHGYEGNGPEHSSARLERFLQLGAQDNIRVANCTTAAQFFHLLRRQALDAVARPLVVMTPKGLLRLKQASSTLEELSDGAFQPGARRSRIAPRRRRAARPLLREALLRHRRPRAPRGGDRGRGRPRRAAVSLPRRGGRGASRDGIRASRRSCGPRRSRRTWAPGGRSATGSRRPCARSSAEASSTSGGRGRRARARATRPRTSASRTASSGRLSGGSS